MPLRAFHGEGRTCPARTTGFGRPTRSGDVGARSTSSPAATPAANSATLIAAVPEDSATAWRASNHSASASS